MIEIKYSGNTVEFERPNEALIFLQQLRDEHDSLIKSLVEPMAVLTTKDKTIYASLLCHASKAHPLKVEIVEYDISDLI